MPTQMTYTCIGQSQEVGGGGVYIRGAGQKIFYTSTLFIETEKLRRNARPETAMILRTPIYIILVRNIIHIWTLENEY